MYAKEARLGKWLSKERAYHNNSEHKRYKAEREAGLREYGYL